MEREKYDWPQSWWHSFTDRRRLSIRDAADDSEKWYIYLSPLRALAAMVALVLVVFFAVLGLVAYTSVLDLIPGSPGGKSRGAHRKYHASGFARTRDESSDGLQREHISHNGGQDAPLYVTFRAWAIPSP